MIDVCDLLIQRGGIAARLAFQLFSAATSVGANLEEATGAISKRDFAAKAGVSLKEARESLYWLRLIAAKIRPLPTDVTALQNESHELVAILTVIVRNAQHSAEWRE